MLVLAIDTTSEHGGVGLFRDADCLASVPNTGSSGYSVTLFQAVDQVLVEAGSQHGRGTFMLRDIELFAVATGPGSFTGIRTGIAATQGWATALGRPTVGISILAAMAHESQPETNWTAVIVDARREEFYFGFFRRGANGNRDTLEAEGESVVLNPADLRKFLEARLNAGMDLSCVARDHDEAAKSLRTNLPGLIPWKTVPDNLVGSIARMALGAYRHGMPQTPAELDAAYIRRSDAELNWRF